MGPVGRADRPGLADPAVSAVPAVPAASVVHARALEARYGARTALAAIDLDVAAGEIVGVLGPNGAGKTTLLRLLAMGRRPASGTLTLLGHDARRPTALLRRRIGIAGDAAVHADALTGRENAVLLARAAGLPPAEAARSIGELLPRFRLEADADRPVAEYSLGMRRRLLLIEALAHGPALLVLDEPTTNLDPQGRDALREVLRERAKRGAAIVLASNDVAEAEQVCTRVVFLLRGRKVMEGGPADLIAEHGGQAQLVRPGLRDVFLRATGEELAP